MRTNKTFYNVYDFGRVFINVIIAFIISTYISLFTFLILDLQIFLFILFIVAFLLTFLPFKKKILSYFTIILLLIPVILFIFNLFSPPPENPVPLGPPLDPFVLFIIIALFIIIPLLLIIIRNDNKSDNEIVPSLKPDLLRSIFFIIYTSVSWTLLNYLVEMDSEFAGIAAIITGLIVAGLDPNKIMGIIK